MLERRKVITAEGLQRKALCKIYTKIIAKKAQKVKAPQRALAEGQPNALDTMASSEEQEQSRGKGSKQNQH